MNMNTKSVNVTNRRVPGFLLGRPRSQWKGVMVRHDHIGREGTRVITLEDVL
jgi:hypothetical protein